MALVCGANGGGSDQEAHEAAVAAVLSVWPTLARKEASVEAVNAIAYATKYHRLDLHGARIDRCV
jgi:hypothetical protein